MKKPTQRSRAQAGKPTAFLTPAENPIRNGTFGDIGAFFTIKLQKPNANVRVEIPYSRGKVRNVSERSLRLFQWNQETHSLWLVGSSGVDLERRRVWAVIAEPGLYGVIGLPSDSGVLRTVAAFAMFSPEELRGSARLVSAICGLILCAAPGDGPPGGGPLCERCLGIEVPEAHFPEIQLHNPDRFGIF